MWILSVVLAGVVLVSFAWGSVFYLRFATTRDWRKRLMSLSVYLWLALYCVVIAKSPEPSLTMLSVAVVLLLLSLLVFWGAVLAHGRSRPAFAFIKTPLTSFVRSGSYRFVRHPFYTSYLIAFLAGAFLAANPLLLVSIPWLGTFYYFAANEEEQSFRDSPFADEYGRYRATTGMLLPKLRTFFCFPARNPPSDPPSDSDPPGTNGL